MDKVLATKAYLRQQARKASDYFKPTENVRVRDFVREVPGAVGQLFSGTRDTFVKGGKILGEGAAYATDKNVRDQYKAGNTEILPTVSNTTPRQMLASTAKAGLEIAPINRIKGLATAAMSARAIPRMAAGGAMGYGYGVADEMSKPGPMNKDTFVGANPVLSLLGGALFGAAASKKGMNWLKESGTNMADDVRNLNPANRTRHKVVGVHDMEPSGIYAAGGIPQMQEIPQSYRQEVRTTVDPFEPQSYLARVLMGKQSPVGMTVEDVSKLNTKINLPNDAEFIDAVKNTTGAEINPTGLKMNVLRYQRPEQGGTESIRSGVFYLPQQGDKNAKFYKGAYGYGGQEKITGNTVVQNPLFVKGATGGKAPEIAFDKLNGKGAYQKMRSDVLGKVVGYNQPEYITEIRVAELLNKYGATENPKEALEVASEIVKKSKGGNTLPYAVQERIVASHVRKAGNDSVLGYSKKRDGSHFLSELFDVRESHYPVQGKEGKVHKSFLKAVDDPLLQEARKYKSAEEFVKAQEVFRGTNAYQEGGAFYTKDKEWARQFTQSGRDTEIKSAFVLDADTYKPSKLPYATGNDEAMAYQDAMVREAKNKGYKAILLNEGVGEPPSVMVLDKSALKTKSQLTDLWKKATKK